VTGPGAQPGAGHLSASSRVACAALTYLARPADALLGALLEVFPADQVLAAIGAGALPAGAEALPAARSATAPAVLARWRSRLPSIAPDAGLAAHAQRGITLVCPGDLDWPTQLNDLGPRRPYALWVRASTSLQALCASAVAIIGARAATSYGTHLASEFAAELAAGGWTIIAGAAYGIDAAAHRGALAASGRTIAVLACGPDQAYPRAHHSLLEDIATHGAVVSESPPGTLPSRELFLQRNRLIAALAAGTVVAEAAAHSGTMAAARHVSALARPLMAVPGPVTSAVSAGCHALIRHGQATCVTSSTDVLTRLAYGTPPAARGR
jgi:DNA processing protein